MRRHKFKISHSLAGIVGLLALEAIFVKALPLIGTAVILATAVVGGTAIVVIATEVIEEVRQSSRMLILLSITIAQFIFFFAFQYYFLEHINPMSFPDLLEDPVTLLLHSTMIFALNPLYFPQTLVGKSVLLVNTVESMVLALFVLQNIWQIHRE